MEKNVPKLRFPGFTDAWEQRKLIDYLEVSKMKNKNETFGKEDVLSVSGDYGVVNQIEFQGRSFAGVSVAPYGVVDTGDIVYTKSPLKSNPYGIIKTNKGKPGIVSTLYAVYKPLDNVCPDFVQVYFEQDSRMNNYMHPLVNKGAKNDMKVSDENALKGEVCFPNKDEQIKISKYFTKLDDFITLQQRKCDEIKNLKKCMLQKMFPKEGEQIPEIRFPGFTDAWEQRKFEECYKISSGYAFKYLDYCQGGLPLINGESIQHGRIDDGNLNYLPKSFADDYSEFILHEKDIVVGLNRPITNGSLKIARIPDKYEGSLLYQRAGKIHIKNNIDKDFSFILLSKEILEFSLKEAVGSDQPFISTTKLDKWEMCFPSSYKEQSIIGSFFTNLDNLITLHQRKLESIKELKKSLLQQMFI